MHNISNALKNLLVFLYIARIKVHLEHVYLHMYTNSALRHVANPLWYLHAYSDSTPV